MRQTWERNERNERNKRKQGPIADCRLTGGYPLAHTHVHVCVCVCVCHHHRHLQQHTGNSNRQLHQKRPCVLTHFAFAVARKKESTPPRQMRFRGFFFVVVVVLVVLVVVVLVANTKPTALHCTAPHCTLAIASFALPPGHSGISTFAAHDYCSLRQQNRSKINSVVSSWGSLMTNQPDQHTQSVCGSVSGWWQVACDENVA